ncbi:MAG: GGDEF domain-containing protein [Mariprofundus sp.]|nr:GGDEF domain-containing protein [Mariprofundus sp.]
MNQQDPIQQLLEDMDVIRPIVLAAMPDDKELRAMTRRMVGELEKMHREPSVSAATYLWLCQLAAKFMDVEHGALLRPGVDGKIPAAVLQSIESHSQQRLTLLTTSLQGIPAASQILNQCCTLIGQKPTADPAIQNKARHLYRLLQESVKNNSALRRELQQLVDALSPSLDAIASLLLEAGEESPELQHVKSILDQELPEDAEQAKKLLQSARAGIMKAGSRLASASLKLQTSIQSNITQLAEMSGKLAQAESEARNDPLTGLANRRYLAEFLDALDSSDFCFVICDIDFFKKVNDTYGHDAGDAILRQLAKILKESIRSTDLAARVGGEEFCIIFPATDTQTCVRLAEALRQAVSIHPFQTEMGNIATTISIGLAQHKDNLTHAETFKAADKALYLAKKNGRNQVKIAD